MFSFKKILIFSLFVFLLAGGWFLYSEIYKAEAQYADKVNFEVKEGESVTNLVDRLEKEQIIRNAYIFKKYIIWKKIDKKIHVGKFEVSKPITLKRVADSLKQIGVDERTITIIPGWDLNDIAEYFAKEKLATEESFFSLLGKPAVNYKAGNMKKPTFDHSSKLLETKPNYVSFEGYIRPDTYRIYQNSSLKEIVDKLVKSREEQISEQMYNDSVNLWDRIYNEENKKFQFTTNFYDILTMASVLEKEVRGQKDKAMVADIFWRRYMVGMALQADSTVHYATGKEGEIFTTKKERDSLSLWNTYKYPGLPLGPICSPSLESIKAAIYPEKNNYWYFLTTLDGEVKYAKTLDEHNANVYKYLK